MVVSIYIVKRKIFLFFLLFPGKSKYKVQCGNLLNCREVFKAILCFARINFKGFFVCFNGCEKCLNYTALKLQNSWCGQVINTEDLDVTNQYHSAVKVSAE